MEEILSYLQNQFPKAEIFPSLDKDFICVREILGNSLFGEKPNQFTVPITKTEKIHIDTVRLKMITE